MCVHATVLQALYIAFRIVITVSSVLHFVGCVVQQERHLASKNTCCKNPPNLFLGLA